MRKTILVEGEGFYNEPEDVEKTVVPLGKTAWFGDRLYVIRFPQAGSFGHMKDIRSEGDGVITADVTLYGNYKDDANNLNFCAVVQPTENKGHYFITKFVLDDTTPWAVNHQGIKYDDSRYVWTAGDVAVPKLCVEALNEYENTWPGATLPQARLGVIIAVIESYEKFKKESNECETGS
jgi:hypothetical protein